MATSGSSRDVKMTLSVETLGAEDIKNLQGNVASLAKEGGDAAPEFQRLADEIGRLGQQAAALQAFQQLAAETGTLAAQQEKAAASATEMGAALKLLEATTQAASAHQRATALALKDAQEAARANRDELALLSATTDRAGKSEDGYTAQVEKLKVAKIEQRAAVEQLQSALQAANAGVSTAAAEEAKLARAYEQATAAANAANQSLQANNAAVAAASSAAAALGVTTGNVAAAQAGLVQGLNQVGKAAGALKVSTDEVRESDRLLALEARTLAAELGHGRDALLAEIAAQNESAALGRKMQAVREAEAQAQQLATAAAERATLARREQSESDRLAIIQLAGLAQARAKGVADLAAERAALADAAKSNRQYIAKLQEAKDQTLATAEAARQAADKISNAFKTVGVRSADELRAEIVQVREALQTVQTASSTTGNAVAGAFAAGKARINELEREIRQVSGTLTTADKAAKLFSTSLGQIAAGNVVADGVGYLVNKVKEMGRAFLDAVVQGDQMRRGLNAIYGDAALTARQIDFLRKSSSESGVAFGSLSGEFVKFSASMKSANIPMEQSNALFKAVTAASASLGLGAEATAGALNALGQMAAKGTVSMEELRQQLGDRLPGALGLSAKGLGITEAQLIKLVESGQLATRDFVGPLTVALTQLKGETDGLVPSWERLKGVMSQVAQAMGDAGVTQVLIGALKALGAVAGGLLLTLSKMVETFMFVAKAMGILAGAATTLTNPLTALKELYREGADRLDKQSAALRTFITGTDGATAAANKHAAAMTTNTAEVVKGIAANTGLSAVQKLAALSAALTADATLDASSKLVQYNVASAELLKLQEVQTEGFTKSAKAAKEKGDTLVKLATLTGEVVTIQKAQAQADELNVAALEKVAASRLAELEILNQAKVKLEEYRLEKGLTVEKIKVETDALEKKTLVARAEVEQTQAAAAAARAEQFQRQLSAQTYADNGKEVDKYRAELEKALLAMAATEEASRRGILTEKDVKDAREAVTAATVRLKDTERDRTLNQQLLTQAIGVNNTLEQAGLNLQMAQLRAAESKAIADGNDYALRQSLIAQKELEIKITTLKIAGQIAEQNATIAGLKLKQAELDIGDPLYAQKMQAIDLYIKAAEAKILEARASGENVAALERELKNLKLGIDARKDHKASIDGGTTAYGQNTEAIKAQEDAMDRLMMKYTLSADYTERQIALLEREAAAHEKAADAERKRLGVDKEGFSTDKNGGRLTMGGDLTTRTGVFNFLKSAGVTDDARAKEITNEFADSMGNIEYFGNKGQKKYGGSGSTISQALLKAAEQFTFAEGNTNKPVASTTPGATPPAPNNSQQPATVSTVNINIGGRSTSVNVASQDDARALTAVLRQLESGKGTAA